MTFTGSSRTARRFIITTVQKFRFILDDIGTAHAGRNFAIIIDEAHSSQGGKATGAMSQALAGVATDDDETTEDVINRLMESRKMLPNASYFAFTATPKNKTLEIFGERSDEAGEAKHRPFHNYSMKQAIQEGFILDVLKHYTPVNSYYRLVKTVEADPEFDTKRAHRKLRRYVESNDHAIRLKAEIMLDHFHEQVSGLNKIGGEARAMVVTSGVERAIQYFHQIRSYLQERKSPYEAIVAFSGEHEYHGSTVTEASLNGFPSNAIPDKIQEHPYRFLGRRRQVPDRLRRAAAPHDVRRQTAFRHQGCPDALASQSRPPRETRHVHPRLPERQRRYRVRVLGLLPDDRSSAARPTPTSCTTSQPALAKARKSIPTTRSHDLVELYLSGADRRAVAPDPRRLRRSLQGRPE